MDSKKTLTSLTITLSFWIGIVLVLLSVHGNFNDKATATPISANFDEQAPVQINNSNTDIPTPLLLETPSTNHTEIAGQIEKGESFDLAMKRLDISDTVRFDIIKAFGKSLDFKMLQPGDRFTIVLDQDSTIFHATYESGLLNTHILKRNEDGNYWVTRQAVPLEYRVERLSGVIESSLYGAFAELGEEPQTHPCLC